MTRVVTVFGGTGFLGRRVVEHLRKHDFSVRIASRHPNRSRALFGSDDPQLQSVAADIHDQRAVADALAGAYGVVNAVGLYVERGRSTFHSVHVEAARGVAARAQRNGVERLVQVSGIGADAASPSLYIRKRGEGELAVRAAFADAILMRPAVIRARRRVFDHRPRIASQPSDLSDVRARPNQIAAGLCGRRGGGDCQSPAADGKAGRHVRVRRASHLLLRGAAPNRCTRSRSHAEADAAPVCCLTSTGVDFRGAPESSRDSQSNRSHADR
jgi:hypothetical protein